MENTITLSVEGMTCGSCAGRVDRALRGVRGVTAVSVDARAKKATVEHAGDPSVEELIAALRDAGYEAEAA